VGIDQQIIEFELFHHIAEAVVEQTNIIAFAQNAGDLTGLDAGRDQENLSFDLAADVAQLHHVRLLQWRICPTNNR
jgi:hypothetical protein